MDTCAALWVSNRSPLARGALDILLDAPAILVSSTTAWEVGQLVSRGRLALAMDPARWWEGLLGAGITVARTEPSTLIKSSFLPGSGLRDPADRIIVATARANDLRIMTRDRPILDYAAAGHVQAIAC